MPETIAAVTPGLRERKKQATRRNIKRAAVRLALDRGPDQITVEAISEAADVSPRTFFNYFSSKEEALIGEDEQVMTELREAILERPEDESPLSTLRHAITASYVTHATNARRDEVLEHQRMVAAYPSLLPRLLAKYAAYERVMADAMAIRFGVDPAEDRRPALLAAVSIAVIRVALQGWAADGSRTLTGLIDEAFDQLERGM